MIFVLGQPLITNICAGLAGLRLYLSQGFVGGGVEQFSVRGDGLVTSGALLVSGSATVSGALVALSGVTLASGDLRVGSLFGCTLDYHSYHVQERERVR